MPAAVPWTTAITGLVQSSTRGDELLRAAHDPADGVADPLRRPGIDGADVGPGAEVLAVGAMTTTRTSGSVLAVTQQSMTSRRAVGDGWRWPPRAGSA